MAGDEPRYRLFSSRGIFDYYYHFFRTAKRPSKLAMVTFFSIILIVPVLGEPSQGTVGSAEFILVFFGLNLVFYATSIAIIRFNRSLQDRRLKAAGTGMRLIITFSITAYTIVTILTFLLGNEVTPVLRATSSMVIIVPLVLLITVLVESVIRLGIVISGSRVPLFLVFMTIFLMMYTFASVYYVNGLLVKSTAIGVPVSVGTAPVTFGDAIYYSGLIFTTLGSSEIYPLGIGKDVTLFESVTGYLVLGFLTAIFFQAIITARGSEGRK